MLALALIPSLSPGCGCAGCGTTFGWSALLPAGLSDADVSALVIRVCRNGQCGQGSVSATFSSSVGGAWVSARSSSSSPLTARRIDVSWFVADPADGDRYAIEVTDAHGNLVVGLAEQAVTYAEYRANGPLDPHLCHSVRFEGSTIDGGVPATDAGSVDAAH